MGGVKHTAGPWIADGTIIRGDRTRECNDSDFIADTGLTVGGTTLPSCEANARLIAAAPDLLEALVELLSATEEAGYVHYAPLRRKARAAIAKATGEMK